MTSEQPQTGPTTERPAMIRNSLAEQSLLRSRNARRWSTVMLSVVGISLIATIARVSQLKTDPDSRLHNAMVHDDGTPIQYLTRPQQQPRGVVYDRRGQVIAMDVPGYRLYCDPRHIYREAMKAAEKAQKKNERLAHDAKKSGKPMSEVEISLDPFGDAIMTVASRMGERPDLMLKEVLDRVPANLRTLRADATDEELATIPRYVILKKDLPDPQLELLHGLRVAGVSVEEKQVRVYPFENTAASLIGMVGADHNGLGGMEHRFEKTLASTPGEVVRLVDNRNQTIAVPADGFRPGAAGDAIQLSIDMNVQAIVEQNLNEAVDAANAGGGRCIVVDVETGEILAMFDTLRGNTGRSPIGVDPSRALHPAFGRNRCITDPYEPGSTFKPFVWSWVTKLGIFTSSSELATPSAGGLVVRDGKSSRLIRDVKYYGRSTWKKVLEKSMNAGMSIAAMRMNKSQMQEALNAFGFGHRTNCGLPGETAGIVTPPKRWTMIYTQCSVAIGQEIGVTPVQMIRAFTTFCRDGSLVELTLQRLAPTVAPMAKRVLPEAVALETRDAMRGVLTEGTGKKAEAVARYQMFGKSGTAQLPNARGGYHQDRYISSFIAGAPFEQPRIAVLVVIEDPDKYRLGANQYGGGAIAGPVAAHIVNEVLEYMGIPPDMLTPDKNVALAH